MSRLIRVAIAIAMVLGGQWLAGQPDIYMPLFDALREEVIMTNDAEIVEMQDDERWFVVIIEFPDALSDSNTETRANAMLMGSNSAATYFSDISNGRSTLTADIQSKIHTANHGEAAYGMDSGGERDVGDGNTGGPAGLVEEALTQTFDNVDLSPYDIDNDGWVDRLLVLHTGGAQEDGGGQNSIWSHYAPLSPGFSVNGKSIGAYTIASFSSDGLGTMIHEMLHMLGAVDLYDVHSDVPSSDWSGVGAWDIMASGNWNGNGRTPALPTSGTLHLIGAQNPLDLTIGTFAPENQSILIQPHVSSTGIVRIPIAPGEYIWLESRVDSGFDREIPGHGLLVSHEDRAHADFEHNEVNRDPEHAYLKIVEADGDGSLDNGTDDDAGDIFTSGSFGADGILIRDGHGRLVPWVVSVDSTSNTGSEITISHQGPSHAEILPPRTPTRLLGSENVPISFTAHQECMPWSQVTSTDGRIVDLVGARMIAEGESVDIPLAFSTAAATGTTGFIEGTIGCGSANPAIDIEFEWSIVANRLIPENMGGEIDVTKIVTMDHILSFEGQGMYQYDVVIEGPLSRIATTGSQQNLGHGSAITLQINPDGLLAPGMIANGKVQLYDQFGLAGEFNVSLQAEPPGPAGSALMWLAEPGNNVQLISILLALWVISSGPKKKKTKKPIRSYKQLDSYQQGHAPNSNEQIIARAQYRGDPYDEFGNLRKNQ